MFRRSFVRRLALTGMAGVPAAHAMTGGAIERRIYQAEHFTCKGCAFGLEVKLREQDGVVKAKATYPEARVVVEFDPGQISEEQIVACAKDLGYTLRRAD